MAAIRKRKTVAGKCCNRGSKEKLRRPGMCRTPNDCAEKMMILSDSTRLRIIRFLLNGGHNVGQIARATNLDSHRISHHLGIMRMVGLVEPKREGRNVIYTIRQSILRKGGIDLGCCFIQFREF